MTTLRNKRKLPAVNRDNHGDDPRNGQARNTIFFKVQEEFFTQVSEEVEARVTQKLSWEFSKREGRFLGALSPLDECVQNPQPRVHPGTAPETSRILDRGNQGTNEDHSQNDSHPEVGVSFSQSL